MRRLLSVLAVVSAVMTVLAVGRHPMATAGVCPDIFFIGARGSDQPWGMGSEVTSFLTEFQSIASEDAYHDLIVEQIALDYPAELFDPLHPSSGYDNSVEAGRTALMVLLGDRASRCASSGFVLVGFSQGGEVILNALYSLGDFVQARISAVALIADPKFAPWDASRKYGTWSLSEWGLLGDYPTPSYFAGITSRICLRSDLICQGMPDGAAIGLAEGGFEIHTEGYTASVLRESARRTYCLAFASQSSPQLRFEDSTGQVGDRFVGNATGFCPDAQARVEIWGPSGKLWDRSDMQIDSSGAFTIQWWGDEPGLYTVRTTDLTTGKPATATFTIEASEAPDVNPVVVVSPTSGVQGTLFSEPGSGFTPGGTVTLYFRSPSGSLSYPLPVKTADGGGSFAHSYQSHSGTAIGQWEYYAVDNTTDIRSPSVFFSVLAPGTPTTTSTSTTSTSTTSTSTSTTTIPPSPLQVSPTEGPQGTTFVITATGLRPNEWVDTQWVSTGGQSGSGTYAQVVGGSGALHLEWPTDLRRNPGVVTLDVWGRESGYLGEVQFTVTEATSVAGALSYHESGDYVWWVVAEDGIDDGSYRGNRFDLCGDGWVDNTIYEVVLWPPDDSGPFVLTDTANGGATPPDGTVHHWCTVISSQFASVDDPIGQWDYEIRLWPSSASYPPGTVDPSTDQVFLRGRYFVQGYGVPAAGVHVYKTVDESLPTVGDEVTFEIKIHSSASQGPIDLTNLVLTDVMSPGLTYRSHWFGAEDTGTFDPTTGQIEIPLLPSGWYAYLYITAVAESSGNVVNHVEVTSVDQRPYNAKPGNGSVDEWDDAQVIVSVQPGADLELSTWADNPIQIIGEAVPVKVAVLNRGPDATTGIEVVNTLPSGLTYLGHSGPGSFERATGLWQVGSLASGERKTLRINTVMTSSGDMANTAEIAASDVRDPDSTPGNGVLTEDDMMAGLLAGQPLPAILRYAGSNRYGTAAATSAADFETADTVFIATGQNFPDALAGAALAGARGAPVLLVQRDAVPHETLAELQRLTPNTIVILGGEAVVSPSVAQQLETYGNVVRLAGSNRYGTAAAISEYGYPGGAPVALVVTGTSFPDALAAGPAAAHLGGPVLLTATDTLPDVTVAELLRLDPDEILVIGGAAVVSDAVLAQLDVIAPTTRIAGPNRYATAVAVSSHAFAPEVPRVYVSVGTNFPDALAGGPAAAIYGSPLLLVQTDAIPTTVVAEIQRLTPYDIVILGGTAVVSSDVAAALQALIPV